MSGRKRKHPTKDDSVGTAKRQNVGKQKPKQKAKKSINTKGKQTATKNAGTSGTFSFSLPDLITNDGWREVLSEELEKDYVKELEKKLTQHYQGGDSVYPPMDLIFNALNMTPLDKIKVVILGQDPYHDDGQAMGLSFSVPRDMKVPPSLKNIYKELNADPDIDGFITPDHGCLEKWAKNGVLLLNATLTVTAHQPNSHSKYGWQSLTDAIIRLVSETQQGVVFILWGGFAHKKEKLIDQKKHAAIKTAHPSSLSFGKFINCRCFSNANGELKKFKKSPVDWTL
ncbi:uracil-DNA glycosylase-like isoform X2 [Crassostrea angulata]|uniref:uracil-DNA glycosylase-like isoform X2 n=1 Tax=Magallana angulata TaxID=2784310 RepID=UPI0022B0AFEF|nr:uracil-DNA glycosylase-like isoform X2 [Crassostrea angulata]